MLRKFQGKFLLLVLFFVERAFAEAQTDSSDCSLKCGDIENYVVNKIHCRQNCNKSEVCLKGCKSGQNYGENREFCNENCYSLASNICKNECTDDQDLETNYKYCKQICNFYDACRLKCDYDNFDRNEKFCVNYCASNSTKNCEETCSTVELFSSSSDCYNGCSRYFPVLCERNCTSTIEFLTNYDYCTKSCSVINVKLCGEHCQTVEQFDANYDFCFNSCDFPEVICRENCLSAENFTLKEDFCYRGCTPLGADVCEKDCLTLENFMKYGFCFDCGLSLFSVCSETCLDKSSFDVNMKFCLENCEDFASEICDEKCNATEIILANKEFCTKGCGYSIITVCEEKCSTEELTNANAEFCQFCETKPIKSPQQIAPGISIRHKTCVSLLCG